MSEEEERERGGREEGREEGEGERTEPYSRPNRLKQLTLQLRSINQRAPARRLRQRQPQDFSASLRLCQ